MHNYDLIVLGAGSGGLACARRAAEYGAKVAIIESTVIGGTCVNLGCIPKKILWNAVNIGAALRYAGDYGFTPTDTAFSWEKLKLASDQYIQGLREIYQKNLDNAQITFIDGHGSFVGDNRIRIGKSTLTALHILIATGSRPIWPEISGANLGIDSDGFFAMPELPKSALIVGAGYIATELAGVLHGLGCKVTMALRRESLLRSFDHSLREILMAEMIREGVEIHTHTRINSLTQTGDGEITVCNDLHESLGRFNQVLWAIGRRPNSDNLNLAALKLAIDQSGYIDVDKWQNTSQAGIYAIGDVTRKPALTPVAIAAGRQLANRLFNDIQDAHLNYENIPSVIFSHPPIGTVGASEEEARQKWGADIKVYQSRFTNLFHAVTREKTPTLIKLITLGKEERLVGCHIVGIAADEIIQGFAVAVKQGLCKADLDETMAIHPTASEELVTLR